MNRERSRQLYIEAQRYLVGGVNSPVRAFRAVGGEPLFIKRGQGSRITDADGNELIDYVGSWGALILGHAHPRVVVALKEAVEAGTSFGAPTQGETYLAQLISQAMPSVERVRFVSSGTEATMSALRLARAFTRRQKVVKFDGCYHGHSDSFLVKAGSGVMTLGAPDSPGVLPVVAQNTLSAPYNDLEAVERLFDAYPGEIAAIIVEPVAANMGVIVSKPGFLQGLQMLAQDNGALLIFDEVITGFRLSYGGAQGLYDIRPDLTCLGKIIGGGLPVAAYGGREVVMELVAPVGPVYQAGTLSGNPLAMAAGIATLEELAKPGVYEALEAKAARLAVGLGEAAAEAGVPIYLARGSSMLTTFFTAEEVKNYQMAKKADAARYAAYFWAMLEEGVYLAPSQFEAAFVSLAHSDADIEDTIAAARRAFWRLKEV